MRLNDMKTLRSLFEGVDYMEVSKSFEGLEQTFLALMEKINLELPENPTERDIWIVLEKNADNWDQIIANRNRELGDKYRSQAMGIFSAVNYNWQNLIKNDEVKDFETIEPIRIWFSQLQAPYSFSHLLYTHQRLRQLKQMIELYQRNADQETKTSCHLFERGVALLHKNAEDYLRRVFDTTEEGEYSNTIHLLSWLKNWLYSYIKKPQIDWIKEKLERETAAEALYQHLKYADLAYRNHTKKGKVVETLKPYALHIKKYGGMNIKGRFHLSGNMNGFIGYKNDMTIIVGFSGTEILSRKNWKTNICQYSGRLDPVYMQAAGLIHSILMGKSHKKGFKDSKVIVCGHSLGGGLMQFSMGMNHRHTEEMEGYGYNSAGLSMTNMRDMEIYKPLNILHLYQPVDVVFVLPFICQLGKSVKSRGMVVGPIRAHLIGGLRRYAGRYKNDVAVIR